MEDWIGCVIQGNPEILILTERNLGVREVYLELKKFFFPHRKGGNVMASGKGQGYTVRLEGRLRWLLVAAALGGMLILTPAAFGAETAKAALKQVMAAGQKWQADAILTHVSTLEAKADGKARAWLYQFYSPKSKKSAIVTALGTKVEIEPDVRTTSVDPIGNFIDSDKALEAARKHGLKADKSIGMGITLMGKATAKPRVLWSVTVMGDTILTWSLDAKDGSLVNKNEVKLK